MTRCASGSSNTSRSPAPGGGRSVRVLGIDLGTTNIAAAISSHVFALSSDGRTSLPAVVAFLPNGHTQTGEQARRRRAIDSENTI